MDLYYEVQGKGEPIVLMHSGMADSRDWEFIVPQLATTYNPHSAPRRHMQSISTF